VAACIASHNKSPPKNLAHKLRAFRQPIVTATGILLDFILHFAASWVKSDTPMPDWMACLVGVSVLAGIILLIRVLRMDYPKDQAEACHAYTPRRG
jgi:hypothetical protein